VHLTPRASNDALVGLHGDALKLRIKAPPVDGRANEALIGFLARCLGVKRGDLALVSGQTSRTKMILVNGLAPEEVITRMGAHLDRI